MHDAKGRELKVGDRVLVPCVVRCVQPNDNYCNIDLQTLGGRAPDGAKNSIGYINTKQVIRANEGDETDFIVVEDGDKTFLR